MHINFAAIRRNISVDEELGRAKLSKSDASKILNLTQNAPVCENSTIIIHEASNQSLTVSLSHDFISETKNGQVFFISKDKISENDQFCSNCAVYDHLRSTPTTVIEIPFSVECGSDNVCMSSLELEAKLDIDTDDVFVLGSRNTLTLDTHIKNVGENAYLTKLLFTLPEEVNFQSTPSNCKELNSTSVICDVDNPLENNHTKNVTVFLDMSIVNEGISDDSLIIKVTVETSSENDLSNSKTLVVKLRRDVDVTITGTSNQEFYPFKKTNQNDTNLVQTYWMRTLGVSSLDEASIDLNVPHFIKTTKKLVEIVRLYPISAKLDDRETIMCESDFAYVINENTADASVDAIISDEKTNNRRKRSPANETDVKFNKPPSTDDNFIKSPSNRTVYINCTTSDVVCSKISCLVRSIKPGQVVKIELNMLLKVSAIKNLLYRKDIILFSTRGNVATVQNFIQSGDKTDTVDVTSLLIGDNVKEMIPLWIVILSVVVGLLLLLLLILGLIKAGFFERKTKEELKQLKKEMEFQEETPDNQL